MPQYDKYGFDPQGYDRNGYDPQGYDRQGYDKNGVNRQGLDQRGKYTFPGMLKTWKTNIGTTTLGVILSYLLLALTLPSNSPFPEDVTLWCYAIFATYFICSIIYALIVYPSYFNNPDQESSKIISFGNGFFGGIIFGLIWNRNLTKKRKGISYIVSIILSSIMLTSVALDVWLGYLDMYLDSIPYLIISPLSFAVMISLIVFATIYTSENSKHMNRAVAVMFIILLTTYVVALSTGSIALAGSFLKDWWIYLGITWSGFFSIVYIFSSIEE